MFPIFYDPFAKKLSDKNDFREGDEVKDDVKVYKETCQSTFLSKENTRGLDGLSRGVSINTELSDDEKWGKI